MDQLNNNENEILYFFEPSINPTETLFKNPEERGLMYSLIRIHNEGADVNLLSSYDLAHNYGKLKNLSNFDYIYELLLPYENQSITEELPDEIVKKIEMYIRVLMPDLIIPYSMKTFNVDILRSNMQTMINLKNSEEAFEKSFFINPNAIDENIVGIFPRINQTRKRILATIFNLNEEDVWISTIDYKYSKFLEECLMNSLIKLCYDVFSWDFDDMMLDNDSESDDGGGGGGAAGTLPQYINQFFKILHDNDGYTELQFILKLIIQFIETDDNDVYQKFIKYLYVSTQQMDSMDLMIERYIKENLNPDVDLTPMYIMFYRPKICLPILHSDQLIEFKNIVNKMDSSKSGKIPDGICPEQFKIFLKTFKFKNNKLISFQADTQSIEFWPISFELLESISYTTNTKFQAIKNYVDFTRPFSEFEALIKSIYFSQVECESLLAFATNFDSFICTLLSSAIHYYNVGTIYFDVAQMYHYLSILPMYVLGNENSKICNINKIMIQKINSLNCIYDNITINISIDLNLLKVLIHSIKAMASDLYELKMICSNYSVPEIYIIKYIKTQSNTHYDNLILALLLENLDISESERILINRICVNLYKEINFQPIDNTTFLNIFNRKNIQTINTKSIFEHYSNMNYDFSCDYNLLLSLKSKYDFVPLFEEILNNRN